MAYQPLVQRITERGTMRTLPVRTPPSSSTWRATPVGRARDLPYWVPPNTARARLFLDTIRLAPPGRAAGANLGRNLQKLHKSHPALYLAIGERWAAAFRGVPRAKWPKEVLVAVTRAEQHHAKKAAERKEAATRARVAEQTPPPPVVPPPPPYSAPAPAVRRPPPLPPAHGLAPATAAELQAVTQFHRQQAREIQAGLVSEAHYPQPIQEIRARASRPAGGRDLVLGIMADQVSFEVPGVEYLEVDRAASQLAPMWPEGQTFEEYGFGPAEIIESAYPSDGARGFTHWSPNELPFTEWAVEAGIDDAEIGWHLDSVMEANASDYWGELAGARELVARRLPFIRPRTEEEEDQVRALTEWADGGLGSGSFRYNPATLGKAITGKPAALATAAAALVVLAQLSTGVDRWSRSSRVQSTARSVGMFAAPLGAIAAGLWIASVLTR